LISDDQRALLRLLLAGDSYEQVSGVLGVTPDEVEKRARAAREALEGEPDPELPADVVGARLAELEAGAVPAEPVEPEPSALRRRWGLWLAAGAGLLVLVVVLVIAISGGGGDDGGSNPSPDTEDVVPIHLSPVGGSSARGGVTLIRIGDQPAVDLDIRGLTPTRADETYVLWFVGSGGRALPIAFKPVGPDGRISGRTAIPSAATGLLPSFTVAELSLTRRRQAVAAIQQAARSGTLPERIGTVVLRGPLRG
jgi:hypothetical protein